MAERKLTVVLAGDSRGLTTALGKADTATGRFGSKVGALGTKAKVALAGAATAVVAFGKSSVDAHVEAEESQSKLSAAYAKFPQLANGNISALRELNSQLALKTKFDDDATASGQAVLAQFGLTQDQLMKLTPLMQDYAERTGKDLPTAAQDLGKAVLGQGRALKAIGVNFKDTGSAAGNFDQLMGSLDKSVGGFAETAGGTAAGKAAILKNQFGELQEAVGSRLVPALLALAGFVNDKVVPALQSIGRFISEHKPLFIALGGIVGTVLVGAFIAWAASAAAAAAATLVAAAPVILITAAIAALAAGVIYAYKNWGWFKTAVDTVARFLKDTLWPALQRVAGFVTGTLIPAIAGIIGKFVEFHVKAAEVARGVVERFIGLVNWFRGLPGMIGRAASAAWNGLKKGLAEAVRWILQKLDTMLGPIDEVLGKLGSLKSFGQGSLTDTVLKSGALGPGKAMGGPVRKGVTYPVGENGIELFTAPSNGYIVPNHRLGGNQTVHETLIMTVDGRELARAERSYERALR